MSGIGHVESRIRTGRLAIVLEAPFERVYTVVTIRAKRALLARPLDGNRRGSELAELNKETTDGRTRHARQREVGGRQRPGDHGVVPATIVAAVTAPPRRVLVVEDDADIADLVRRYLQKSGYDVDIRLTGRDALRAIVESQPDLLILDLMLPEVSGLDICRAVRSNEKTASIPIIMVTARAEASERIAGLDLGADDYLAKPFSPGELVARVRALLRRSVRTAAAEATIHYGPLVLDAARHTVTSGGQPVTLTAKEFLLLQYVLRNRGRVLSRDVLLTDVWGYTYTGGTRTVDVHVRRLREKLPFLETALVTVKQFGYRLLEKPQVAIPRGD